MGYEPGERIGDYEVIGILGHGGMGQVYKVRNVFSKRVEAMKVLLPDLEGNPQLAERFTQEMEVQAALEHPNIAPLHSAQRVGNQLLMTMEFVEGSSIENLLHTGPLPVATALDFTVQVLSALAYAHARGVVHRDVKPANMMVTPAGTVKLLDFGVAKLKDRQLTQTGHTVGSLYYMAPEQISEPLNVDARADLYSAGVALYQMVTGQRPFQGESDYSIMSAHMTGVPIPPIQIQPHLPEALNDAMLMAIAKDRDRRFQSADAMRRALEGLRAEIGPAPAWQPSAVAGASAASSGSSAGVTATVAMPTPVPASVPTAAEPAAQVGTPHGVGAPVPAPVRRSGIRGLYLAGGVLLAVLVLAVLAWKVPQMVGSRVQARIDVTQDTANKAQEFAQKLERDMTERMTEAVRNQDTEAVAAAAAKQAAEAVNAPQNRPSDRMPGVPPAHREHARAAAPPAPPTALAAPGVPEPAASSAGAPATPQQSQASAAQPDPEAVREARRQLLGLAVRARAAAASVQALRQQQARMGLGMRGDIVAAQAQLEGSLDEAQESIRSADAQEAGEALKKAERALERLEKFLGR